MILQEITLGSNCSSATLDIHTHSKILYLKLINENDKNVDYIAANASKTLLILLDSTKGL